MSAYYNECDPFAAEWLRRLIAAGHIAPGDVDVRPIQLVSADDLRGYRQAHFFAGIGGWSYALRLAGWPDDRPVWTGSCPCQPFSAAGKQRGSADERHLWSEFFRLIQASRPQVVFGEQVASAEVVGTKQEADFLIAVQSGDYARANKLANKLVKTKGFHFFRRWIDALHADLARIKYALRCKVLGAHSVGAPHIRQRLWFVADRLADTKRRPAERQRFDMAGAPPDRCGKASQQRIRPDVGSGSADSRGMGNANDAGLERHSGDEPRKQEPGRIDSESQRHFAAPGDPGGMADSMQSGRPKGWTKPRVRPASWGSMGDVQWLDCTDGKTRPIESGLQPLAHGIPGRVGRLRAYGNAIVPQVAAEFIVAYLEAQQGRNK